MIPEDVGSKSGNDLQARKVYFLVAISIVSDLSTILFFVQLGMNGQGPPNFAFAMAFFLGSAIGMIWLTPWKYSTAACWIFGVLFGLLLGDLLLGLPLNGPIPNRPGLEFQRILGPIIGGTGLAGLLNLVLGILSIWNHWHAPINPEN